MVDYFIRNQKVLDSILEYFKFYFGFILGFEKLFQNVFLAMKKSGFKEMSYLFFTFFL